MYHASINDNNDKISTISNFVEGGKGATLATLATLICINDMIQIFYFVVVSELISYTCSCNLY